MRIAQSSHLQAHEYDGPSKMLTIQFVNGAVYRYANVPQTVYDTLSQHSTPGGYFHAKIKSKYPTVMIAGGTRKKR